MTGVFLGDKHSYKDFGLILTSKTIAPADVKTDIIEIPGADGAIDITEALTGDVKYQNRKISMNFEIKNRKIFYPNTYSKIQNYLHGQKMKLIFDDDKAFYYIGRLSVNSWKSNKSTYSIVIDAEVDPYKYDRFSTLEDWEWDPFDFTTGIIQRFVDMQVNGVLEVEIIGRRMQVVPRILSDSQMTVVHNGVSYSINAGITQILNIVIKEGKNTIKFIGKGKVSIDYRGGSL